MDTFRYTEEIGKAISKRLNDSIESAIKSGQFKDVKNFANSVEIDYQTVRTHKDTDTRGAFRIDFLMKYSTALGISTDYLLFGKEYSKPKEAIEQYSIEDVYKAIDILISFYGIGIFQTNQLDWCNQTELTINDNGIANYIDAIYDIQSNQPALEFIRDHGMYESYIDNVRNESINNSKTSPAVFIIGEETK